MVFPVVRMSCLSRSLARVRESVSLVMFNSAATMRFGCSSRISTGALSYGIGQCLKSQWMQRASAVFQGQIIEQGDHRSQVLAHRCKHSQRKLRPFAQQRQEFCFRNKNHRARRQCARAGGIAFSGGKSRFGKGVAGMKDMDDLHLPRSADAMDVDHASLHNEEALARLSFAEEIFAFLQISHC